MNFEFDLESAECELEDVENLLSVFFGFFNEERPFGKNIDAAAAFWFVNQCEIYKSVLNAAWDKIRKLRTDMEAVTCGEVKKGGEVA